MSKYSKVTAWRDTALNFGSDPKFEDRTYHDLGQLRHISAGFTIGWEKGGPPAYLVLLAGVYLVEGHIDLGVGGVFILDAADDGTERMPRPCLFGTNRPPKPTENQIAFWRWLQTCNRETLEAFRDNPSVAVRNHLGQFVLRFREEVRIELELESTVGRPTPDQLTKFLRRPFEARIETLADDLDRDPTAPMPFNFVGAQVSWE